MSKHLRWLDTATNVAIIAASVSLVYFVAMRTSAERRAVANAPSGIEAGEVLNLSGVAWGTGPQTLVLALNQTCNYCTASGPFYRRINKEVPDANLIAMLPHPVEESKTYLASLGVSVRQIVQADFDSLNVRGTPTLLLVDREGVVRTIWRGQLDDSRQAQVIAALRDRS